MRVQTYPRDRVTSCHFRDLSMFAFGRELKHGPKVTPCYGAQHPVGPCDHHFMLSSGAAVAGACGERPQLKIALLAPDSDRKCSHTPWRPRCFWPSGSETHKPDTYIESGQLLLGKFNQSTHRGHGGRH
jgi:hypothetical protein